MTTELLTKDENGLLPCPFCGEKAHIVKHTSHRAVWCSNQCGASVRSSTKDGAVKAWNRRVPTNYDVGYLTATSEMLADIERLREILLLIEGKNSTNFKLKAPDYLIDKLDAALALTSKYNGMKGKV